METVTLTNSTWFVVTVIPLLIFLARVIDVSIGTLRLIFVTRGRKYLAGLLGFFESLVWILAISQVIQHLDNWIAYFAFAAGFAAGNLVGIMIEERIALGNQIIRVITRHEADTLVGVLRREGYGVTAVDAEGEAGPVKVIFTIVRRRTLPKVIGLIKQHNPNAFYTIEDVRFVKETLFTAPLSPSRNPFRLARVRK